MTRRIRPGIAIAAIGLLWLLGVWCDWQQREVERRVREVPAAGDEVRTLDTLKMLLTVYDSTPGINGGSRTCTGRKLRVGDCAADLSLFPLGTVLHVLELGCSLIVADCGGAIRGHRLDWFRPGSSGDKRLWRCETVTVVAPAQGEGKE